MMDLELKITKPNTELKSLIGEEKFKELTMEMIDFHDNTCQCCGWKPKVENNENDDQFEYKKRHLILHLIESDNETTVNSKTTIIIFTNNGPATLHRQACLQPP
mgnify:CR=1 FL=1